jgi:putative ABC transport system substrate-binding protein
MVELGIIKTMAHPGGNITGLSKLTPELAPKRLSLLKETLPSIKRVGVLWNPGYSAFTSDWRELREAAAALGITLVAFEFRRPDDFETAFTAIRRERLDALMMFSDPTVYSQAKRVAALASATRIPTMFPFREVPDAGGLRSYGPNLGEMWRRSADYVVRILKGANPADMAIEQPTRLEFVVNLKAARAIGIEVPQSVRLQATDLIQ